MAHQALHLSEVLEELRGDESGDLVRQMVAFLYLALIDAEATEVVKAERYGRSLARTSQRNGSRPRLLTTKAGDVVEARCTQGSAPTLPDSPIARSSRAGRMSPCPNISRRSSRTTSCG
ncbi:MAG: transposase [Acidobacteriota bacterium]|nr:transposase [Acidobacteriota bacterium]